MLVKNSYNMTVCPETNMLMGPGSHFKMIPNVNIVMKEKKT